MIELCRHFGGCGGCAFQDMPDPDYRAMKRSSIAEALARNGLADCEIAEILPAPPATRRRASFKAKKRSGEASLGFHARASHAIVDMQECRLLTPTLFARTAGLRAMVQELLAEGEEAELAVMESETGIDVVLQWRKASSASVLRQLAAWCERLGIARLSLNGEIAVGLAQPSVIFGKARVFPPPGSFLQATRTSELLLQAHVRAGIARARAVADLFAGCGTFALVLAETARVHAVEFDGPALASLADAARRTQGLKPVTVERRDLQRLPLTAPELRAFDAVVLNPPRAGAAAQAAALARSAVPRAVYVSCNPVSFARDARHLVDGGYRLGTVVPVDQFLWSSHIELVASFIRT